MQESLNSGVKGAPIDVPMQEASIDIWRQKYQCRTNSGVKIDRYMDDSYLRVAKALADVEATPELRTYWHDEFVWALRNGAVPAGRIMSNAGALEYKPNTSLINCTVSGTIIDSMPGILTGVSEGGLTLAAGCGIGYDFSTLRPKGAFVAGVGAKTSGAISFMGIYDAMCFTVASAGGRRGAQMGTLDVSHPDVKDFIRAKRENGRLRQFNLSLLITDDFMQAVVNDGDWDLVFPLNRKETWEGRTVWKEWPYTSEKHMIVNQQGRVKCRVYDTIKARHLWDMIMSSTYDFAEPGFILIDRVNRENNLWFCENIRATNPCGEQALPPYGACLLGSINLTKFLRWVPDSKAFYFDFDMYAKVCEIFTRMLDNVVELNGLPLQQQRDEIVRKRRHGMGYFGLGSVCALLGYRYGDKNAQAFTSRVSEIMAIKGWEVGLSLAKEKGPAPIMEEDFSATVGNLPEGAKGEKVKGRHLFVQSRYLQRVLKDRLDILTGIANYGCRFTHHTSIAPTGTIALSFGNNASNGIEPSFAHEYKRNVIREGRNAKESVTVYSYEALVARQYGLEFLDSFATAEDIAPEDHVAMQAAAQPWIDACISKTANVPSDFPYEDFKEIYVMAWEQGLKGCTTFRFNPAAFQGVLVKEKDLANTTYVFTLDDGSKVEAKGNQMISYEGEEQTAANLYDAIKEGYFGRL